MSDEERLKAKLRAIEALFAGAATEGERDAADRARQRISARLSELQQDAQIEWQFSLTPWSYRLLVALARRYGLRPYRYKRQRHLTLVVKASERFLTETFLPEFDKMHDTLNAHLDAVAERVIAEVLNDDTSEADTIDKQPAQLEAFVTPSHTATK
jgi:hypothetical protein